jgi:hypothetical protein
MILWRRARQEFGRQIEALRKENDELRERVVAAQHAKSVAIKQSEDLRRQKERLRERLVVLKRESAAQEKVHVRLQTRIHELQQEIDSLK